MPLRSKMLRLRLTVMVLCLLATAGASSGQSASPRKYDEFVEYNCEDMMARLDNYAIVLQSEPKMRGYVVSYGGTGGLFEARRWAVAAKVYLTSNRGIEDERVVMLYGGRRSRRAFVLWLVPEDYGAPTAAQTARPQGVKFKRLRMKHPPCEMI